MSNEGRFLNKRFAQLDGIVTDSGNSIVNESGWSIIGGARIGDGGTLIANVISAAQVVSLNVGSAVGSLNYTRDTVVSGVLPGDVIQATPVGSTPLSLIWSALCYTADVVQIRALHVGSFATGAMAGTSWRIVAHRF